MRYLLDVNVLVGFAMNDHVFNDRVVRWIGSLKRDGDTLVTCAITELAFVRIMTHLSGGTVTVADAKRHISETKARLRIPVDLIADTHGANELPLWVITGKQTTDGHLAELAKANGAVFATLDGKIPGAFVIPESV